VTENERWSESILVFVSVSTPIHKGGFFFPKKNWHVNRRSRAMPDFRECSAVVAMSLDRTTRCIMSRRLTAIVNKPSRILKHPLLCNSVGAQPRFLSEDHQMWQGLAHCPSMTHGGTEESVPAFWNWEAN
jgi:hypothetical protein